MSSNFLLQHSRYAMIFTVLFVFACIPVFASDGAVPNYAMVFLWMGIALLAARLGGLVEKFKQPAVLGELIVGALLGNVGLIGITFFEPMKTNDYMHFLAEIGVVVLLFQVGLESNVGHIKQVGIKSLLVASIGVLVPFVLGSYIAGPLLMPGLSQHAYMFLGATLTATSVGITARVFKDFGMLSSKEAQIVLGAAVIDDVMGLIILAIVSSVVQTGDITIWNLSQTILLSIAFLGGGTFLGMLLAPKLGKWLSTINAGSGMKLTFALCVGLFFAFLAQQIGLAPIVGAFTAGLLLDSVHFKHFESPTIVTEIHKAVADTSIEVKKKISSVTEFYEKRHIEDILEPIGQFLTPIFFIITGMAVDFSVFADFHVLIIALGLSLVAIVGKLVSGFFAGRGSRKWIIGWGMVPRGEVGLIFASVGKSLGVVDITEYSVIVIVIMITTIITPVMLASLLRKN